MSKGKKVGTIKYKIVVDSDYIDAQLLKITNGWRSKIAKTLFKIGAVIAKRKMKVPYTIEQEPIPFKTQKWTR